MKKAIFSIYLIALLLGLFQTAAIARISFDVPVEVIEVRDLGLSDRDESRSLIEVRWQVDPDTREKIVSFNLVLSITYADGTTISANRKATANALSARFEIPSVKSIGSRPPAFIKKMDARVTAVISKN